LSITKTSEKAESLNRNLNAWKTVAGLWDLGRTLWLARDWPGHKLMSPLVDNIATWPSAELICIYALGSLRLTFPRVRSLDNFSHISLALFLAPQSVSFPESHKLCIPHIFKRSNPSNWLYPKLARNSQKLELLFEYFTEPSILLFPFRESICLRRFPEQVYLTYKWANI